MNLFERGYPPGWYVMHGEHVLRGPYQHQETAVVLRAEIEGNLQVVECKPPPNVCSVCNNEVGPSVDGLYFCYRCSHVTHETT